MTYSLRKLEYRMTLVKVACLYDEIRGQC